MRELERAVSLKPDDPVLNDHLGDAYWRAGRQLEATFQWAHARDMKPDKDVLASVQKKLAEGLPPLDGKTAAEPQTAAPEPPAVEPPPVEKKSELQRSRRAGGRPHADRCASCRPPIRCSRASRCGRSPSTSSATASRYLEILSLNPQLRRDPGRIVPGQELKLPALRTELTARLAPAHLTLP